MKKYCKNCAAYIDESADFCPDCGKEITHKEQYCPNCKSIITNDKFCRNCGIEIKKSPKKSFAEKYQTPIIIITLIAIIAGFAIIANGELNADSSDVDTLSFTIPEDYILDLDSEMDEVINETHLSSKTWYSDSDYIQIDVTYPEGYDIDENDTLSELDGKSTVMMDHKGKYAKEDGLHEFSFVEDSKLCTITVTDKAIFDEIEILD